MTAPIKWAAPTLDNPITIDLPTGKSQHKLDPAKDYIVKFPATQKAGSTSLIGGRNIHIIGGSVMVPAADDIRRALYIKDAEGTVHIEGVEIDVASDALGDGIAISAPKAIVQVQNCWIRVRGTQDQFHGDIIQPWGGVKELLINGLTGYSSYQGLQLPDQDSTGATAYVEIDNVDLHSFDKQIPLGTAPTGGNGGFLLWMASSSRAIRTKLGPNVCLEGRPERSKGQIAWPSDSQPKGMESVVNGDRVTWPKCPEIEGYVTLGKRPEGENVPRASVGIGYQAGTVAEPTPEPTPPPPPPPPPAPPEPASMSEVAARIEKARTEINALENTLNRSVSASQRGDTAKAEMEAKAASLAARRALYAVDRARDEIAAA